MTRAWSTTAKPEGQGNSYDSAFALFLDKGDRSALVDYLLSRSNLPGPHANLELLHRFSDSVEQQCNGHCDELWDLCVSFVSIPQDKAFTGSSMEFIPMCGTVGFGAIGVSNDSARNPYFERSMERLKAIAGDPRWRVRESVAIALQKVLERSRKRAVRTLSEWIEPEQWLQMRAVAAGIAEPPLLKDPMLCHHALALHQEIVGHVVKYLDATQAPTVTEVMRAEPFRKLVQALQYSLSVVVAASPEEGFVFLKELTKNASSRNGNPGSAKTASVLRKILKGNLKKNRLVRPFPKRVDELMELLD